MNPDPSRWLPLAVLAWPALLACLTAVRAARPLLIALVPTAAGLALVTALVAPDTELALPVTLLGGALALDAMTRVALATSALLWLAAGWLLVGHRREGGADLRPATLALLGMAGTFALALADDGLLWLAAGTLAGYALCGLILCDANRAARAAGRRLVALLVLGDLVLFELLLVLAHAAGGTSFESLRAAVAQSDSPAFILGLMILGFGLKAGVPGVHLWLLPAFRSAPPGVRPALIAFISAAGVLGWLRLLPLGEIAWPGPGSVLQWLAAGTAAYALVAGVGRVPREGSGGGLLLALTAQWLWLLGVAMRHPGAGASIAGPLPLVVLQSGVGLAALVLMDDAARARGGRRPRLLRWLAAGLILLAPWPTVTSVMHVGAVPVQEILLPSVAVGLLTGQLLLGGSRDRTPSRGAASVAHVGGARAAARARLSSAQARLRHLLRIRLPAWRDALFDRLLALLSATGWRGGPARIEARLAHWGSACLMLVLLGLGAAWLG